MSGLNAGAHHAKGRRELLSPRRPLIEQSVSMLAGLVDLDGYDVADVRRFGNALIRDVDLWYHMNGRRNRLREGDASTYRAWGGRE